MRYALLVVAGGILFGTTGTVSALAPDGATPTSIGSARLAFGGLMLGLIGLVAHLRARREVAPIPLPTALTAGTPGQDPGTSVAADAAREPAASTSSTGGTPAGRGAPTSPTPRGRIAREWLVVVVCAGVIMLYQPTFLQGNQSNGVMVGTMVALGSSPVLAGLFEWVALRRRPTLAWLGATVLAVGGVFALSRTSESQAHVSLAGLGDSLIAGACYAVLAVGAKWLLQHDWRPLDVSAATMIVGAAMAFPTLARTDGAWLATPRGLAVAGWLALATIVAAYILNITGLAHTSAASATTLNLAEPTTATILSMIVLGEQMTAIHGLGIAAIVGGVLLLGLTTRATPAPSDGT